MKSPSALEPKFTAEDWTIVEGIESGVEKYLQDHPDSTHVNFVPNANQHGSADIGTSWFGAYERPAGWWR